MNTVVSHGLPWPPLDITHPSLLSGTDLRGGLSPAHSRPASRRGGHHTCVPKRCLGTARCVLGWGASHPEHVPIAGLAGMGPGKRGEAGLRAELAPGWVRLRAQLAPQSLDLRVQGPRAQRAGPPVGLRPQLVPWKALTSPPS